jgi:hypothetical protein
MYYAKRQGMGVSEIITSARLLRQHWNETQKASGAFIDGFVEMATIVAQARRNPAQLLKG